MVFKIEPETKQVLEQFTSNSISFEDLLARTGLPAPKIEIAVSELKTHQLLEEHQEQKELYELTPEGEAHLQKGLLPEQELFQKLQQQELPMSQIMKNLFSDPNAAKAAVGKLKKMGIVEITKGVMRLKEGSSLPSQDLLAALKDVAEAKTPDTALLKELLNRRLVERKIRKLRVFKLKRPLAEILPEVQVLEEKARLTPRMLETGTWKQYRFKKYNFAAKPKERYFGRKHPYLRFLDELKQKLVSLGFKEMRGPIVEMEFWNFDALFQAQDHPAREWSDVYRIKTPALGKLPSEPYVDHVAQTHENGWKTGSKGWRYKWDPSKAARLILRAQGTSVSARTLVGLQAPSKYFSVARCYRPDVIDATHLPEFNQVEGIIYDPSITFRDLLGILKEFAMDIAGAEKFDFRPDFYPFTSPSVELGAIHPELGRIEFGGAGIFRPEVTEPFGLEYPVIAWGLGVDRLFMVNQGISDIRHLFSTDIKWLRNARI